MIWLLLLPALHAEVIDVAFEGMVFDVQNARTRVTMGEGLRKIEETLEKSHVQVLKRKPSYFDNNPPDAPLRLALHVMEMDCFSRQEDRWTCLTTGTWELYHVPSDTIVYRGTIKSGAVESDVPEAMTSALMKSATALANRPGFEKRLDSSFYPIKLRPEDLRVCEQPNPDQAAWTTSNTATRAWALDLTGQVLVVGESPDTISLRQEQGPSLEGKRRTALPAKGTLQAAVYHLPVVHAQACVDDTFTLPESTYGATNVGQVLALLGSNRISEGKPELLVERFDSPGSKSLELGRDPELRGEEPDVRDLDRNPIARRIWNGALVGLVVILLIAAAG